MRNHLSFKAFVAPSSADACTPSCRLALVAAFLVSPFGAAERTWKPFNPLLGETFELEGLGSGVRFMAEQVRGIRFCVCRQQ